jgi:hypothetical protein
MDADPEPSTIIDIHHYDERIEILPRKSLALEQIAERQGPLTASCSSSSMSRMTS